MCISALNAVYNQCKLKMMLFGIGIDLSNKWIPKYLIWISGNFLESKLFEHPNVGAVSFCQQYFGLISIMYCAFQTIDASAWCTICIMKDLCGSAWIALFYVPFCVVFQYAHIVRVCCNWIVDLMFMTKNHCIACNNGTGNFYREASTSQRVIASI